MVDVYAYVYVCVCVCVCVCLISLTKTLSTFSIFFFRSILANVGFTPKHFHPETKSVVINFIYLNKFPSILISFSLSNRIFREKERERHRDRDRNNNRTRSRDREIDRF